MNPNNDELYVWCYFKESVVYKAFITLTIIKKNLTKGEKRTWIEISCKKE